MVDVEAVTKEWNMWQMTQLIGSFYYENTEVKTRFIRLQRMIEQGERRTIELDIQVPKKKVDMFGIRFWHAGSTSSLKVHGISIKKLHVEN